MGFGLCDEEVVTCAEGWVEGVMRENRSWGGRGGGGRGSKKHWVVCLVVVFDCKRC